MIELGPIVKHGLGGDSDEISARVLRTCLWLLLPVSTFVWIEAGGPAGAGFLAGAVLGVTNLFLLQLEARRILGGRSRPVPFFILVTPLKLGFIAAAVIGLEVAAGELISLPWIIPGFSLPPVVALLKIAGAKLISQTSGVRAGGVPGVRRG